jgi:hypothetical protein
MNGATFDIRSRNGSTNATLLFTEQAKTMRKLIYLAVLGATTCTAIFYLVGGYAVSHPTSLLARCCGIAQTGAAPRNLNHRLGSAVTAWTTEAPTGAEEELGLMEGEASCVPDEPETVDVDALLPDPEKLTANRQPLETIDLLRTAGILNLASEEDSDRQPPYGPMQQNSFPAGVVPAAAIRSADEAECFRLMPNCETPERLSMMPQLDESVTSELDEGSQQEPEDEPMVDPKTIEERLQRVLRSYLEDGCCPRRTGVDTLEFRPSDAKKGEFDRIPF